MSAPSEADASPTQADTKTAKAETFWCGTRETEKTN